MAKYWLMKSEPGVYSIDDLKKDRSTLWDGIRNYQARNFMTTSMTVGDLFLFYHSNSEPPGVAGLGVIEGEAVTDPTALDPKSASFDAKATPEKPIWSCVPVAFKKKFRRLVSLPEIRATKELQNMVLLQKGSRLSIQPVTEHEFELLCKLGDK